MHGLLQWGEVNTVDAIERSGKRFDSAEVALHHLDAVGGSATSGLLVSARMSLAPAAIK